MLLTDHMKETADIIAGYKTGRLIIDGATVSLMLKNNTEMLLDDTHIIEVRNHMEYVRITMDQARTTMTAEGWPLFAGLYTRVKGNG